MLPLLCTLGLAETPPETRLEPAGLPALAYSTDNGLGIGLLGNLALISPDHNPYRWKLYALGKGTFQRLDDGVHLKAYNAFFDVDFPGLLENRLRFQARASVNRSLNLAYYGVGNINVEVEDAGEHYHQYERVFPELTAQGRIGVFDRSTEEQRRRLELVVSLQALYSQLTPYEGSLLKEDLATLDTDPLAADLLRGTESHALVGAGTGLIWDTRDHESIPLAGGTISLGLSAAAGTAEDIRYGQLKFDIRRYQAIFDRYLSLAGRMQWDLILGNAPMYVLDGSRDSFSIRGVRTRRYLGPVKAITSAEVRSMPVQFSLFRQRFLLGGAVFFDAGRVWSAWSGAADLNGGMWAIHTGTGGGLRLQWGEAFLVRFDRAVSPSDETTGTYLVIGAAF